MNCKTGGICLFLICLAAVLWIRPAVPAVFARSEQPRVIKVGYFAFDGYHKEDKNGVKSGYGYDFLQYLARYANITYEYAGYGDSWEEMQQMLENGEIDLVTSARKTKARLKKFAYSDRNIGFSSAILTVKSGDNSIRAGDYKTYDGIHVAMLRGNSRNADFRAFAKKHGFRYKPVYYETAEGLHLALMEGVVEAALTSDLRVMRNEDCVERFGKSPFYVITRKEDKELMEQINDAIAQMDERQPGWREQLRRKYYTLDAAGLSLTAEEKQYIREISDNGNKLLVISHPDAAPYSYTDRSGNAAGILPDFFQKVVERTGIPCQILVPDTQQAYDELLSSGNASICLDMPDGLSEAENAGYKLTDCYFDRQTDGERKRFCMGVNKNMDVRLLSVLNKGIAGSGTEEIETIADQYIQKDGILSGGLQNDPNLWKTGLAVESLVLLILCVILFLRSYRMAFTYRKKSKNLQKGRKTYGNNKHDNG